MKFNWFSATTPRLSKQRGNGFEYQQFEPRNLLAGDLVGQLGNEAFLVDQLAQREDTAWTQKGLNDLVAVASESDRNGTTTVFQQSWNGLAVFDSWVTVVQNTEGEITNVRDHAKQNVEGYARDTNPINERLATRIGSQDLGSASDLQSETSLAWFYAGNKARLSWLVETAVIDADGDVSGEYETWVNVFDGSIFHREAKGDTAANLIADPITETGVFPRIVINDAIGPQGSRDFAAPFDSVAFMSVGCTGTLISPNTVISARHCGNIASVTFGDNSNSGQTFTVASTVFPAGGNSGSPLLDGGDVSILTLNQDVPASVATPVRFIDATDDLVGLTAVTVGYGFNGVGSTGHGFSSDGFRWGGENVIDAFGSPAGSSGANIISTDFDDGTNGSNTIGSSSSTPLTFEATTAPGDSGGPILVDVGGEWVIAGVLSGGTSSTSVYGDISWWTGTAVYRSQIEDAGGTFIGDGAGSVLFDSDTYIVGDSVDIRVRDGNAVGDVTVTVTSDSGDSETITISATSAGLYDTTINTSEDAASANDGVLQVAVGDVITVDYVDVDDGNGNTVDQSDSADIIGVPPPGLIGIDFDDAANAPENWLSNLGAAGSFSDLNNEQGFGTSVDLTINGASDGFAVPLNGNTIPQYTNSLSDVDGQVFTGADPIEFVYSDLSPLTEYNIYVMSAEGFFDTIEQTVTIQGDGSPISFEQRFNQGDLFVNDQVGDSSRALTEYAISVTSNASGVISVNVDPIAGTDDVAIAGLGLFEVPQQIIAAPEIVLNDAESDRSIIREVVVSFDDIVTFSPGAFELIKRGTGGGAVDVNPVIDNSSGSSVVTLELSGAFAGVAGLVDGNYQLTVVGDLITSSFGTAIDGDGDGTAGGDLVFGDTEADNFFRFFGDLDGNRGVDVFDLLGFRQAFSTSAGDSAFNEQVDSNADGIVNVFDLLAFRNNFRDTLDFT